MHYFSGFCFKNEKEIFSHLPLVEDIFTFTGFSYGAIKAYQTALLSLEEGRRVQRVNLLSPAFFQTKTPSFLKMQIMGFRKDSQKYIKNFLSLCGNVNAKYLNMGTIQELQELLYFKWESQQLKRLQDSGVQINVFIGEKDQIISPQEVREFFLPYCTIYSYKNFNHCLSCDHL